MTQRKLAPRSQSWLLLPGLLLAAGCPAAEDERTVDEVADGGGPDAAADRAVPLADAPAGDTPGVGLVDAAVPAEDAALATSDAVVVSDAELPPGNTVRLKLLTDTEEDTKLVAFQDGAGPWRLLFGANGDYSTQTATGRFGIAWVCNARRGAVTSQYRVVYQALVTEAAAFTYDCRGGQSAGVTLSGSVTGFGAGRYGHVNVRNWGFIVDEGTPAFNANLAPGIYDVLVARSTAEGDAESFVFRKDVKVEAAPVTLSFDLAQAKPVVSLPLTVDGLVPEEGSGLRSSELVSAGGTRCNLGDCGSGLCPALPASELRPDDLHHLSVETEQGDPIKRTRSVHVFQRGNAPVAVTLPAPFAPPTVTRTASGLDVAFADYPGAQAYLGFVDAWTVIVSAGWLGAGATHRYQSPALSALAGWQAAWSFQAATSWEIGATASNRPTARLFNDLAPPYATRGVADLDGARVSTASVKTSF